MKAKLYPAETYVIVCKETGEPVRIKSKSGWISSGAAKAAYNNHTKERFDDQDVYEIRQYKVEANNPEITAPEAAYRKLYDKYADVVLERDQLINLVTAAKCPCCDGSGAFYDNYGDMCQCQWCDEKNAILKEMKGDDNG